MIGANEVGMLLGVIAIFVAAVIMWAVAIAISESWDE